MQHLIRISPFFKQDILNGVHGIGDEYVIALYREDSGVSHLTPRYSPDGEVRARGYPAGGRALAGRMTGVIGDLAFLTFTRPVVFTNCDISARYGLIYNASRDNRTVMCIDLGSNKTATNGDFSIVFPPPNGNALWRF